MPNHIVFTHGCVFRNMEAPDATEAAMAVARMYVMDHDTDIFEPRDAVDFTVSSTEYNGHPCNRVEWDFVWGKDHPRPGCRTRASALVFVSGTEPNYVRHF